MIVVISTSEPIVVSIEKDGVGFGVTLSPVDVCIAEVMVGLVVVLISVDKTNLCDVPNEEGWYVTAGGISVLFVVICVVVSSAIDSVGIAETEVVVACRVEGPFVAGVIIVIDTVE